LPRRARFAGFEGAVTSSSGAAAGFRLLRVRVDIVVSEKAELGGVFCYELNPTIVAELLFQVTALSRGLMGR